MLHLTRVVTSRFCSSSGRWATSLEFPKSLHRFSSALATISLVMNQLCLLTNLSSSEWAAWVQAIGSIAAVIGTALVAIWQSRKQHQISLAVLRTEHRLQREETSKALLVISRNTSREIVRVIGQLHDRDAVHSIAEKSVYFDFNEVRVLEHAILGIPLHSLPHNLVSLTMILSSTVRQFRESVETALERHRTLDAEEFAKFFSILGEMRRTLELTCADIEAEVNRSEPET